MENPFNPDTPVQGIEGFFGRTEIVEQILSGLKGKRSFGVIGGRRIGKTSLLNYVAKVLEGCCDDETIFIPITVDLHRLTPKSRSSFFNHILQKTVDFLNRKKPLHLTPQDFVVPTIIEDEFDLEVVLMVLQKLENICFDNWADFKAICLIDEFEYLEDKPYAEDLISNMRVMISNHPLRNFISLIIFGNRFLYEMSDIKGSPLDNIMTVIQLGAMEPESAVEMVCSSLQTKSVPGFVEEACAISGYHPHVIKYIMRDLWGKCKTDIVSEDDIRKVCESFLAQSSVFRLWYKEFNDLDKRIYWEFAKKVENKYVRLSIADLVNVCQSDFVEDSVVKLFYHGLLRKEEHNTYHVIPSLFMEWFSTKFSSKGLTFNIDLEVYRKLFETTNKGYTDKQRKEQGDSLENLAQYLIECCSGLLVEKKAQTAIGEIDLLVTNKNSSYSFLSDVGDIIGECKNWNKKVGVQPIQTFRLRMEEFGTRLGLYFSKEGITGNEASAAKKQIFDLYSKKKYCLVVVTLKDLKAISNGEDFLTLLENKMREIRFQRL